MQNSMKRTHQSGICTHDTPKRLIMQLIKEANDLARDVLPSGFLVVHDTGRGGENNVTELTGWEKLNNPLLEVGETDVVTGGNDTGLVETAVQLHHDLSTSMVVDRLKFTNVACQKMLGNVATI